MTTVSKFGTAFIAALGLAIPATAATITTYTNRAAFEAAISGETTIDFNALGGSTPGAGNVYGNTVSASGVDFTNPNPLNVGGLTTTNGTGGISVFNANVYSDPGTTTAYLANYLATGGMQISFGSPVFGFGMDLGSVFDSLSSGQTNPNIGFNFASSSQVATLTQGYLDTDGADLLFFGYTSDVAFSSITVTDPTAAVAMDNFSFGALANSQQPDNGVPEPATMALLGFGLAGLGLARRKRG